MFTMHQRKHKEGNDCHLHANCALGHHDRLLELTGQGTQGQTLKEAFLARIQSPSYQNGSDDDSYYTRSSRVNQLRMLQNEFHDRALRQLEREFSGLIEVLHGDKANRLGVRTGWRPRTGMEKILELNK